MEAAKAAIAHDDNVIARLGGLADGLGQWGDRAVDSDCLASGSQRGQCCLGVPIERVLALLR